MNAPRPTSRWLAAFAFALFAIGVGAAPPPFSAPAHAQPIDGPQRGLRVEPLSIQTPRGVKRFSVEIAETPRTREIGMMWRDAAPPGTGMLFDFHRPQEVAFWMRNTLISLDLVFIRADGTILRVTPNATPLSLQALPSGGPIRAVLEIGAGEAARLGLAPGQRVSHRIFPKARARR
jgi:uncharacterized membrane protein (UPF0127 family)